MAQKVFTTEKVRELALLMFDSGHLTLPEHETILTKWFKQNPIEPVVVGLSEEQVIAWCDYIDWEENSYYTEKFTGWLKTQTFAPILKREPLSYV